MEMKDYYSTIFLKLVNANSELDDIVVKSIIDVVTNINYIDLALSIVTPPKTTL